MIKQTEQVTTQDALARLAGVTRLTVHRALTGQRGVGKKTAQKIQELARSHGYRPHSAARSLQSSQTRQIGVLLRNESDPDFRYTNLNAFEMMIGLNDTLASEGYVVSFVHIHEVQSDLAKQSRVFAEHMLDALIVTGNTPTELSHKIPQLVPCCFWLDSDVYLKHNCLRRDEHQAGYQLASLACSNGYRKLLWVGDVSKRNRHYSAFERFEGVRRAAEQFDCPVVTLDYEPWHHQQAFQTSLQRHLAPDVAVLGYDIVTTRCVAHTAAEVSLLPPRDFGLACFDDNQETRTSWPQLTRVSFNRYDMGRQAAVAVLELLRAETQTIPSRRISNHLHQGSTLSKLESRD